jgi:hypothetical protein
MVNCLFLNCEKSTPNFINSIHLHIIPCSARMGVQG